MAKSFLFDNDFVQPTGQSLSFNAGTTGYRGWATKRSDGSDLASTAVWTAATAWNQVPEMTVQLGISIPDISGDGNTVVSIDKVWNANTGTLPITTVLSNAGCDFSGWSNLIVTGVDFDGNTFCGYGTDPQGRTEAWYATVPAPASALVFAAALLGARRRR